MKTKVIVDENIEKTFDDSISICTKGYKDIEELQKQVKELKQELEAVKEDTRKSLDEINQFLQLAHLRGVGLIPVVRSD